MPSLIPSALRTDLRPGIPDSFCLVIKDKEDCCYAFGAESYLWGFKNPKWELPLGDFIAEIEIRSGNANKTFKFLLNNKGNAIQDVEIHELRIDRKKSHDK